MDGIRALLRAHAERYPLAKPCDFVKLLFQQEFGGEHLLQDPQKAREYLEEEYRVWISRERKEQEPLWENLGEGVGRLHLKAVDPECFPLECLHRMFIMSAENKTGSKDSFQKKLKILREEAEMGRFTFSLSQLDDFLRPYEASGAGSVRHSPEYREAYAPAYRLIDSRYIPLLPVIREIYRLLQKKKRIFVAVDGHAAAGKSTAGALLSHLFPSNCIHMDDFFLPPSLRTEERLRQPGGNVHYERFQEEVLLPLRRELPFSYAAFDCGTGDYGSRVFLHPRPVEIVEGSYSQHPFFGDAYDLRVFCSVSPEKQKERILMRNGETGWRMFRERWIPLEHTYFSAFSIETASDLQIQTEEKTIFGY